MNECVYLQNRIKDLFPEIWEKKNGKQLETTQSAVNETK